MRTILFLLCCSMSGLSFAQKYYLPGHVITSQGDTLKGNVMDRKLGLFPEFYRKLRFKNSKGKKKKFDPSQLNGYQRGEETFVTLPIQEETIKFKNYYFISQEGGISQHYKVISLGYLSYLQAQFYDQESGALCYSTFFLKTNHNQLIPATQGFLGLKRKRLREYLAECPPLMEALENKSIKTPEEVVALYNLWMQEKTMP